MHMFEDDALFTPCHSDMQSTEGVKEKIGPYEPELIWHFGT